MKYESAANYVRLRGLPFNCTEEQIREFLSGIEVLEIIFNPSTSGRPSGECYCQLKCPEDVKIAKAKDRQNIGTRYVEVFEVGEVEMEQVLHRSRVKNSTSNKGFIRIRGLPYNCKREDIITFFKDLNVEEVVFGKESGFEGRPTGDGFVQFSTNAEADQALQLNGQHLGNRYLEIFKIDGGAFEVYRDRSIRPVRPLFKVEPNYNSWGYPQHEAFSGYGYEPYGGPPYTDYGRYDSVYGYDKTPGKGRPYRGPVSERYNPYGPPPGRGSHYSSRAVAGYGVSAPYDDFEGGFTGKASSSKLFIRGLPFRITSKEIQDFFAPLQCVNIQLGVLSDGRSSGDGIVEFASPQDAAQALKKDRQNIGNRIPTNTRYESVSSRSLMSNLIGPNQPLYSPAFNHQPPYEHWNTDDRTLYPGASYFGNKQPKYNW